MPRVDEVRVSEDFADFRTGATKTISMQVSPCEKTFLDIEKVRVHLYLRNKDSLKVLGTSFLEIKLPPMSLDLKASSLRVPLVFDNSRCGFEASYEFKNTVYLNSYSDYARDLEVTLHMPDKCEETIANLAVFGVNIRAVS